MHFLMIKLFWIKLQAATTKHLVDCNAFLSTTLFLLPLMMPYYLYIVTYFVYYH